MQNKQKDVKSGNCFCKKQRVCCLKHRIHHLNDLVKCTDSQQATASLNDPSTEGENSGLLFVAKSDG